MCLELLYLVIYRFSNVQQSVVADKLDDLLEVAELYSEIYRT